MAKQNNTREAADTANPTSIPVPNTSGYPETKVKTAGVKTRGNGCATKGTQARGPMA